MIVFRNDDISPSTDLENLYLLYESIARLYPDSQIISGVTLFGVWNDKESVYPDLPLKDKPTEWFYKVNRILHRHSSVIGELASHGLFHVKHADISEDAQKMSILGSCNYLGTKKFIAPFNSYNAVTQKICDDNKIELMTSKYQWKSLDYEKFNSNHKFWSFHSWRYTVESLKEKLNADIANCVNMGLV